MTDEVLAHLLVRLQRKLRLDELDESAVMLLEDALLDAEGEILLYLNRPELPTGMEAKVVELAAVFYRRDITGNPGLKAASYSEGDVSQNETYMTAAEYQTAMDEVLASIAHWRCRAT